jgi:F-type H+-transporting ATPase subunit gamma
VIDSFDLSAAKTISLETAQPVADLILREFNEDRADVVTLFYSRFRSVISQVPTARQLIPAVVEAGSEPVSLNGAVYTYEPDEQGILETLLPRNVAIQILSALLENAAGEQSARMQAMDNATRNAGELIGDLTLLYNRQRQARITTELIEIIAGSEAL